MLDDEAKLIELVPTHRAITPQVLFIDADATYGWNRCGNRARHALWACVDQGFLELTTDWKVARINNGL